MTYQVLETEAKKLSRLERFKLLEFLLQLFAKEKDNLVLTSEQMDEIRHRSKMYHKGQTNAIPSEQVLNTLLEKYAPKH